MPLTAAARNRALRGWLRRHRMALATGTVAVVGAATVIVCAAMARGNPPYHATLNDGAVWVSTDRSSYGSAYGQISAQTYQYTASVLPENPRGNIDVLQDGSAVLGWDRAGTLTAINPITAQAAASDSISIGNDIPALGGNDELGSAAVLDPASGKLWATSFDASQPPDFSALDPTGKPVASVGAKGAVAVGTDGAIYTASLAGGLNTFVPSGTGFVRTHAALPGGLAGRISVTAVGDVAVVLVAADNQANPLIILPHRAPITMANGRSAILQQPSATNSFSYLETPSALLSVDLASGQVETVHGPQTGTTAAAPVYLRGCVFAAWSNGTAALTNRNCGSGWQSAEVSPRVAEPITDVAYRVNHGDLLLNDLPSGAVFNVLGQPTAIDNWDRVRQPRATTTKQPNKNPNDGQTRKPPTAVDDTRGVRAGTAEPQVTELNVLDNDGGSGGVLTVASVTQPTTSQATVTIAPDRQSVLVAVNAGAPPSFSFRYADSNGSKTLSKQAIVTVHVVPDGTYDAPNLRYRPSGTQLPDQQTWSVAANATLSIPVLNDWRNYGTGDPVAIDPLNSQSVHRGRAITTPSGTIEYQAPSAPGDDTITYTTSDATAESPKQTLHIRVLTGASHGTPPTANDDYTRGTVGVPFTFNPLLNDLPGADPASPGATLQLLNSVKSTKPGLTVTSQSADGTLTLLGTAAGRYALNYGDSYGTVRSAPATVYVDIDSTDTTATIQTAPDSVTVHGTGAGLVDVLSNDFDPSGQLLAVVKVSVPDSGNLTAAVVEGRWVRVNATQPALTPRVETLSYTVTDGLANRTATGQISVVEMPPLDAASPIVETDYATVRQGDEVTVPVLDNDVTQDGSALSLVQDFDQAPSAAPVAHGQLPVRFVANVRGNPGSAYVAGNTVRFTAPVAKQVKTSQQVLVTYQVLATDGSSQTGSVFVTITPPGTRQNDQAPVPADVQARVVAGGSTVIAIPTSGVDPDGDTVQVVGLAANPDGTVGPKLGAITKISADSLQYAAFPSATNGGTDVFRYTVVDTYGVTAVATIEVAVVGPTVLPAPVPHPISVTAAPGTTIRVQVVSPANVDYAEGDAPTLVDPRKGTAAEDPHVTLAPGDPTSLDIAVPATAKSAFSVGYQVQGDAGPPQASGITIHVEKGYVAPPVAIDQFAQFNNSPDTVHVNLLKGDFSQSGGRLQVIVPTKGLAGSTLAIPVTALPQVIPYVIRDSDGGEATAVVYVPAGGQSGLPYWNGRSIHIPAPGKPYQVDITSYVKSPGGEPFHLTTKNAVWTAPVRLLTPTVSNNTTIDLNSQRDASGNWYQGPASLTFPVVTTDDLNAVTYITVPVIVGTPSPVLRCPTDDIPVTQGFDSNPIDVAAECHVWTASGDTASLRFTLGVRKVVRGVSVARSGVYRPVIRADSDAPVHGTGTLTVGIVGVHGPTSELGVVVEAAPQLTIASIPVQTVTAGATTTIDLEHYMQSPFGASAIHFIGAPQTHNTVRAVTAGQFSLAVTPESQADLTAAITFIVGDNNDRARDQSGILLLQVLDVPTQPGNVVPRPDYHDKTIGLDWVGSSPRGAGPVRYQVEYRPKSGGAWSAPLSAGTSTAFSVPVPANGVAYVFQVRGCNGVRTPGADGCGAWSSTSPPGVADRVPGPVIGLSASLPSGAGSTSPLGSMVLTWSPPADDSSAQGFAYTVTWPGAARPIIVRGRDSRTVTVNDLPNDVSEQFTVQTQNEASHGVAGAPNEVSGESAGKPAAPTWSTSSPFSATESADGSTRVVTLRWNPVDPNGPGPTYYTVSRTDDRGSPAREVCTNVVETTCNDSTGIKNDGTLYTYAVYASNRANQLPRRQGDFASAPTAAPPMQASDDPSGITGLQAAPTGADHTAQLTFDLGASHGKTSFVECTVNGKTCEGSPWTFSTGPHANVLETVTGLPNGQPANFTLTACNNADTTDNHDAYSGKPCVDGGAASATPYGQFGPATVTASQNGNLITWSASGNANGRDVSVEVSDAQHTYDHTFDPEGPTSWSASDQFTLPPQTTDTVTVVVSDTGTTPTTRKVKTSISNSVTTPPLTLSGGPSCNPPSGTSVYCSWGPAQDKGSVQYHLSWYGGSDTTSATNYTMNSLPQDGNVHTFSVYATDDTGHTSGALQTNYTDPPVPAWNVTANVETCPQDQWRTSRWHAGPPPTCDASVGWIKKGTALTVVCRMYESNWPENTTGNKYWDLISSSPYNRGWYINTSDFDGSTSGIPSC